EILQTSLSSTSIYRIFLFMQRLAVISALASNNSDIEKQKNEVVPILKKKVLTNMKLQILSSEVSLLLPNCDFHDIKRNLLEQKEPKMDNIELIFKIPDIKADLELNNYSSNFSKVIKLTAPYIGILGINGFKEPIYTCTNAIVKVEIPWVSSVLEVNGMPSTKIAKPDISVHYTFDQGCVSIPYSYNLSEVIDGTSLMYKCFKTLKKKQKADVEKVISMMQSHIDGLNKNSVGTLKLTQIIKQVSGLSKIPIPNLRKDILSFEKYGNNISKPDDIPTIELHGKSLTFIIQDDPFETALSRIYQIGKIEQAERLARMDAFERKIQSKKSSHIPSSIRSNSKTNKHQIPLKKSKKSKDDISKNFTLNETKKLKSEDNLNKLKTGLKDKKSYHSLQNIVDSNNGSSNASTLSSSKAERTMPPMLDNKLTKASSEYIGHSAHNTRKTSVSHSLQDSDFRAGGETDVRSERTSTKEKARFDYENFVSKAQYKLYEFESNNWIKTIRKFKADKNTGSFNTHPINVSSNFDLVSSKESLLPVSSSLFSSLSSLDSAPNLNTTSQSLDNLPQSNSERPSKKNNLGNNKEILETYIISQSDCGDFPDKLLFKLFEPSPCEHVITHGLTNKKVKQTTKPPYKYKHSSWRFPIVPLFTISLKPIRVKLTTPKDLMEFRQIERYIKEIDQSTPLNQLWSTLIPIKFLVKAGELKVQIRDHPVPFLYIPDPYKSSDPVEMEARHKQNLATFRDGVTIEGGLVVSEQAVNFEQDQNVEAARMASVPLCIVPRNCEVIDNIPELVSAGLFSTVLDKHVLRLPFIKSLMLLRLHTNFSLISNNAATDTSAKALRLFESGKIEELNGYGISFDDISNIIKLGRLPASSPMLCWGQRIQPIFSDISRKFGGLFSPSSEPSPEISWWDKIRSRIHLKCRLTSVDIPLKELATKDSFVNENIKRFRKINDKKIEREQTTEFLFYTPNGRDPYSFLINDRGYLFSFKGGARLALGEWDSSDYGVSQTFKNQYVIDLGNASENKLGISPALSEILKIRCRSFIAGIPEINTKETNAFTMMSKHQVSRSNTKIIEHDAGNLVFEKQLLNLVNLGKVDLSDYQLKAGFLSNSREPFRKYLCATYGGVRLSIGFGCTISLPKTKTTHNPGCHLSSGSLNIPFNRTDLKSQLNEECTCFSSSSHWNIRPHAPENIPRSKKAFHDAFSGFRSSGIHLGLSILYPYEREEEDKPGHNINKSLTTISKNSIYNSTRPNQNLSSANGISSPKSLMKGSNMNDDRHTDSLYNTGSLMSECRSSSGDSDAPSIRNSSSKNNTVQDTSNQEIRNSETGSDLYPESREYNVSTISNENESVELHSHSESSVFCNISPLHGCKIRGCVYYNQQFIQGFSAAEVAYDIDDYEDDEFQSKKCNIYSGILTTQMFFNYLSFFASRLMLPIRKGKLYNSIQNSDIKFGQSLISLRLGIDLAGIQLSYSQQTSETKELETQELIDLCKILGSYSGDPELLNNIKPFFDNYKATGSISGASIATGMDGPISAKSEGTITQLKARSNLVQANLLMVQRRQKMKLDPKDTNLNADRKQAQPNQPTKTANTNIRVPKGEKREDTSLRWWVQDTEAEIDDFDVRVIKMNYSVPLYFKFQPQPISATPNKWRGIRKNGLYLSPASASYLEEHPDKLDWLNFYSVFDLDSFSLKNAIFSLVDVMHILWAPRLVYFTQSNIQSDNLEHAQEIGPLNNLSEHKDFDNLASLNETYLSAENNVQTGNVRFPNMPLEPEEYEKLLEKRHLAKYLHIVDALSELKSRTRFFSSEISGDYKNVSRASFLKSDTNALSQVQSYNSLMNIGRKKGNMSKENKYSENISRKLSKYRMANGNEATIDPLSILESDRKQIEKIVEYTNDNNLGALDYKKILRDSRLTQSMLLARRKERLGYAVQHYDLKHKEKVRAFELDPDISQKSYYDEIIKSANEIFELSMRRRLINRCLRMLGVDPAALDSGNGEDMNLNTNLEGGMNLQASEDVTARELEALYRHRFLLHSAYLIWNSEIRDILFRFFSNEDTWKTIKYFMSQTAAQVVDELSKENAKDDQNSLDSASTPTPSKKKNIDIKKSLDSTKLRFLRRKDQTHRKYPISQENFTNNDRGEVDLDQKPKEYNGSGFGKDSAKKTKPINLDFNLQDEPKTNREKYNKNNDNDDDEEIDTTRQFLNDFESFIPQYSALIEFLNSQVSLCVDNNSNDSM
ncbi:hypothetical protein BB559_006097, partial [Furculomyces boomerangus]